MFVNTFQPSSSPARLRRSLGAPVSESVRVAMLDKIQAGENRLAAVLKWVASRIDLDPMLLRTFGQQHISDNFWGYNELVEKDQYYVDQAVQILNDDLSGWDISEEISSRVGDWSAAIDIMYDAMQRYGKTPLTDAAGQPIQSTVAPAAGGTTAVTTTGSNKIPAGTDVNTEPPSAGISTQKVLLYGSIGVATIALIMIAKKFL
jgi:hypothetical protein